MDANELLFPIAKRFVAGTSIATALTAVARLNDDGFAVTLDFLGEDVHTAAEAEVTVTQYLALISALQAGSFKANLSIKLSALGLLEDQTQTAARLERVLIAAAALPDPFVRVDMERASTVEATLAIVTAFHDRGFAIGPVLQAYLRRTPRDVENMIAKKIRVRLCKGAYSEPPEVAFGNQAAIRREFMRSAESLLGNGHYPGIATHDPGIIDAVKRLTTQQEIDPARFEFQLLYGVRPALQKSLVAAGYRVRIYVPFGTHWTGYFQRRIMERRENAVFALQALFTR